MSYTKTDWYNKNETPPGGGSRPKVNKANLNKIEQGVFDAHQGVIGFEAQGDARWQKQLDLVNPVKDFGVVKGLNYANSAANSVALEDAFNTQKAIVLEGGDYVIDTTLKPNLNRAIYTTGRVRFFANPAGDFAQIKTPQGIGIGKYLVFDVNNLGFAVVHPLELWCNDIANIIGFGAEQEDTTFTQKPISIFMQPQVWQADWGIWGNDNNGVTVLGALTGTIWQSFECHTKNGIRLGNQQDDLTFINPRVLFGFDSTSVGIEKAGAGNCVIASAYVSQRNTANGGTYIKCNAGSRMRIESIFLEGYSNINQKGKPISMLGTAASPAILNIGQLEVNVGDASAASPDPGNGFAVPTAGDNDWLQIDGPYNKFQIDDCINKEALGSKPNNALVRLTNAYTPPAPCHIHGRIRYQGDDDGTQTIVRYPSDVTVSNNLNTDLWIEVAARTGRRLYNGVVRDASQAQGLLTSGRNATHSAASWPIGQTYQSIVTETGYPVIGIVLNFFESVSRNAQLLFSKADADGNIRYRMWEQVSAAWSAWRTLARCDQSADRGPEINASGTGTLTLTMMDAAYINIDTALTKNGTIVLPATGAAASSRFVIVRRGLGAFTLDVGGLKTIPASASARVEVTRNVANTAWQLAAYQRLDAT